MNAKAKAKVLMAGPDLSLKGGIVSVVKGYLDAGIAERCDRFCYLGTVEGSNVPAKALSFVRSLWRFKAVVDDYDIVHLHTSKGGSLKRKTMLARVAVERGKKVIFHEHNSEFKRDFESGDQAFRDGVRSSFELADKVVVLSEEWRDYFAENVCPVEKIVVLHNGVAVPAKPCSPCSHQDVLFLGRLDVNKSPDVLLRASRGMLEAHPEAKLLFGGDGHPERYEALAQELGIAERCEFLGWVSGSEKERLFERAAVYCLPSKHEGMPMGVLEAMAHGIPAIATPVGGVPQIIQDGVNGFLIPVDGVDELSNVLAWVIGSPELRERAGRAAYECVSSCFNVADSVATLMNLYDGIIR